MTLPDLTWPYLASYFTSPCLTSLSFTSSYFTSYLLPHLTLPHSLSPHLASHPLTSHDLTSPYLTLPHLLSTSAGGSNARVGQSNGYDPIDVKIAVKKLLVRRLRGMILQTGRRSDGRPVDGVRPIEIGTTTYIHYSTDCCHTHTVRYTTVKYRVQSHTYSTV